MTDKGVLDKIVVAFLSVQTDLTENNFPENLIPLTLLYREDYHNTFTKQPTKTSANVVVSLNFDWSMGLVILSVKDCIVLWHKCNNTAVVIETIYLFSFDSFVPWDVIVQQFPYSRTLF